MAHRVQGVGAAGADEVMDVDRGNRGGMAHSRHNPNTTIANSTQCNQTETEPAQGRKRPVADVITDFIKELQDHIPPAVLGRVREAINFVAETARQEADPGNICTPIGTLTQTIETAVNKAIQNLPKPAAAPATWASIAARGLAAAVPPQRSPAPLTVPPRIHREVLIKGNTISEILQNRTPIEIVDAVNRATAEGAAVAARRLHSGDTIVTFKEEKAKYATDTT
ncbi:uncharacterized protein UV8b_03731 [Ustilaginoidea virens]|uniref:Uncharacterized protein n=1 Tax=Ustilaginoidea virens TaxID=1159556 RepID=A0A8E5HPW4_USTVR|nr:uncharacterized protein UV8b_03731 [Ustilaginoidea virens]QUC19490.1 hypothetical protein UV8b_03731 [Ustilaginoidea virens]